MKCAVLLQDLQYHILSAIQHGEFLLSTNHFSRVWIDEFHHHQESQAVLHDILTAFCSRYIREHEGTYVFGNLEQYDSTIPHGSSAVMLTRKVVEEINHPQLQFHKALVDPDSFEVLLEEVPEASQLFLFVLPSIPHDLLVAACQNLAMTEHGVAGIVTPVECEHLNGNELRHTLGLDFIPFTIYDSKTEQIASILEMTTDPYIRYHKYFDA